MKDRGKWLILSILLFWLFFAFLPDILFAILNSLPKFSAYGYGSWGPVIVHFLCYVIFNSLFILAYLAKSPLIESYKVIPDPWPWETDPNFNKKVIQVIKSSLINQFLVIPIMLVIIRPKGTLLIDEKDFPSLFTNFYQILFFMIVEDFFFYWTHRLIHMSFLYKYIHKQHHDFNVTISVSSEYTHPIEYALGNILPVNAGPLIFGRGRVHAVTYYMWVIFRTVFAIEAHSGYFVPWSPFKILPFTTSTILDV